MTHWQSKYITQVTLYSCALWPSAELLLFFFLPHMPVFPPLVGFSFDVCQYIKTQLSMQFVSFYICIGLQKEKRSKSECCSQMEGKNKCLASIRPYCHRTRLRVLFLSKSATFCVLLHDKPTIVSSELPQSHGPLELYQWQTFIGQGGCQGRMSRAKERQNPLFINN